MRDMLKKHGSALEDEFFRRVDDELAIRLKEQWDHQRDIESLRQESPIQDEIVLGELLHVGIQPGTLQAMTLVPAVHVAWANGFIENKERDAVLQAAQTVGIDQASTTGQLLLVWLNQKPTSELFQVWEDYVRALGCVIDALSHRHLRDRTVGMANEIAKAAGGILGIHPISLAEQKAINQIVEAFRS